MVRCLLMKSNIWYLGNRETLCSFHRSDSHPPEDGRYSFFISEYGKKQLAKNKNLHGFGKSPIFLWRCNLQDAHKENHKNKTIRLCGTVTHAYLGY